jgi:hypothetical protein
VAITLTAACGGGSDNSSGGGEQNGNGNGGGRNTAFAAYIECLNKNGVTIAMPSGGVRNRPSDGASRGPRTFPSGEPRPSGSGFPGGGFPGGGGFGNQKPEGVDDATWEKAQAACASVRPSMGAGNGNRGGGRNAAYQNCLKDNGVTTTGGKLDTTDPKVKAAVEKCKVLEPQASPTPSA